MDANANANANTANANANANAGGSTIALRERCSGELQNAFSDLINSKQKMQLTSYFLHYTDFPI